MDIAVSLVQAYLQLCGYFTVTEYPVIESRRPGYRVMTDLDVLAVRFAGARTLVPARRQGRAGLSDKHGRHAVLPPPAAFRQPGAGHADMIIGEVKEGRAELNRAARDPLVLRAVLVRFGCCDEDHVGDAVQDLLRTGKAVLPAGHHARLVAFGSSAPSTPGLGYPYEIMLLGDVVRDVRQFLRDHWEVIHHAQFKDPALGFLMTLEKSYASSAGADEQTSGY